MQSDVPPLPISCLTDRSRLSSFRIHNKFKAKQITGLPSKSASNNCTSKKYMLPNSSPKKHLHSLYVCPSPHSKNTNRFNPLDSLKARKNVVNERISSAKMLRIKQLQNQLADAHYHLNELSNENKLLKAIQKRQDSALKRYEGTNAELPRIINNHHEDLRVLQTKHNKLKCEYKNLTDKMKEKENELQSLQAQNKKLLHLNKDRNLLERDKLQSQIVDLTHKINEQDEAIQNLKRKLALETKYLKHQLHAEMVKHKEVDKQLQEALFKLKSTEDLLEQKEKRSYQASRLSFHGKSIKVSAAVTSLHKDSAFFSSLDSVGETNKSSRPNDCNFDGEQTLPILNGFTNCNGGIKSYNHQLRLQSNHHHAAPAFELLPNYDTDENVCSVMAPPLLNCANREGICMQKDRTKCTTNNNENKRLINRRRQNHNCNNSSNGSSVNKITKPLLAQRNNNNNNNNSNNNNNNDGSDECASRNIIDENQTNRIFELLPSRTNIHEVRDKIFVTEKEDDSPARNNDEADSSNLTTRSRLLHARLVSSAGEGAARNKEKSQRPDCSKNRSRSLTKENLAKIAEIEAAEIKYDRDSVVTVIAKEPTLKEADAGEKKIIDDAANKVADLDYDYDDDDDDDEDDMGENSNYSSDDDDVESEIELPIELNGEEDNDTLRRSDIIIEDEEALIGGVSHSKVKAEEEKAAGEKSAAAEEASVVFSRSNNKLQKRGIIKSAGIITSDEDNNDCANTSAAFTPWDCNDSSSRKSSTAANLSRVESEIFDKLVLVDDDDDNNTISTRQDNVNTMIIDSMENNDKGSFDKAKLLAAMKAIDNNENIEFVQQKAARRNGSSNSRLQITENLYRGLPTHSKKKNDIMKELFADGK